MNGRWPKHLVNDEVIESISVELVRHSRLLAGVKHEDIHTNRVQIKQIVILNGFLYYPV